MYDIEFIMSNFVGWKVFYETHFRSIDWALFKLVLMFSSLVRLIVWTISKPVIRHVSPTSLARVDFKITRWRTFLLATWQDGRDEKSLA